MVKPLFRKIIYFTGGAIALIAVIGVAGIAYLAWPEWSRNQHIRAVIKEETRTHDRPLISERSDENVIEANASEALAAVRIPDSGHADTLNFVSMPSFSAWRAVSISLSPGAAEAQGRIVGILRIGYSAPMRLFGEKSFSVTRAAFLQIALKVDRLTDGWPGNGDHLCYDGTPVAFERHSRGRTTSGWGNAACDNHYAALEEDVAAFIHRYSPDPGPVPAGR